jgi:hypothetical protein
MPVSLFDLHNISFSYADGVPALGEAGLPAAEGERLALPSADAQPEPPGADL